MLSSFMQGDGKGKKVVESSSPLLYYSFTRLLPFNCSFHSCMNMKNDYDDKYEERKRERKKGKKASRMLEQLLGYGCTQNPWNETFIIHKRPLASAFCLCVYQYVYLYGQSSHKDIMEHNMETIQIEIFLHIASLMTWGAFELIRIFCLISFFYD